MLSLKHQRFVTEYLKDFNASQAAIRTGYKARNADVTGSQLLGKIGIQQAIAEATKNGGITPEWLIKRYRRLAETDVRKLYNEDGTMKLPHELDDDTAYGIAGIEMEERRILGGDNGPDIAICTKKVKRWDINKALDALGRHIGFFNADKSGGVNLTVNLEQLVLAAAKVEQR